MKARPEGQLTSIHRRTLPVLGASLGRLAKVQRPTPEAPLIISASEIRDFLRCRVKWWWRHQCRLERTTGGEALAVGSLTHEILEHWYTREPARRTVKGMERIARDRIKATTLQQLQTEDKELVQAMTVGYAAWAKEDDKRIGLVTCNPEQWFELPLTKDGSVRVRGVIDNTFASAVHKHTFACQETKTAGQFRETLVDTNLQLSVYLWALRQLYPGYSRYICHFTRLRKQMPTARVRADLFDRQAIERTAAEVDQWARDAEVIAMEMLDAAVYPSPSDACAWDCDYQNPCLLRGDAEDLTHVLTTEYRVKERR